MTAWDRCSKRELPEGTVRWVVAWYETPKPCDQYDDHNPVIDNAEEYAMPYVGARCKGLALSYAQRKANSLVGNPSAPWHFCQVRRETWRVSGPYGCWEHDDLIEVDAEAGGP